LRWHPQSEKFFSVFNSLTPRVLIRHSDFLCPFGDKILFL
jgi:hypothetical protein